MFVCFFNMFPASRIRYPPQIFDLCIIFPYLIWLNFAANLYIHLTCLLDWVVIFVYLKRFGFWLPVWQVLSVWTGIIYGLLVVSHRTAYMYFNKCWSFTHTQTLIQIKCTAEFASAFPISLLFLSGSNSTKFSVNSTVNHYHDSYLIVHVVNHFNRSLSCLLL